MQILLKENLIKIKIYLLRIFVSVRLDHARRRGPAMQQKKISLKENIQLAAFGFGFVFQ